MSLPRISRTSYYMEIARVVALRSTCIRAQVGAVLVNPKTHRIVGMGYNGSAKGAKHCIEEGCLLHKEHCIRTIHAELNAILSLEKNYDSLLLYCTHKPCIHCTKALLGANIVGVTYINDYKDEARDILLKEISNAPYFLQYDILTRNIRC